MATHNPSEMTETQLRKALDRARARQMRANEALIEAGRGHELASETRAKSDPLAVAWQHAMDAVGVLLAEAARRERYHGSLKRIR